MPNFSLGTSRPPVHRGQVGQPSPEPVSRTAPPVTTMPTLATTEASASRRRVAGESAQPVIRRDRGRAGTSVGGVLTPTGTTSPLECSLPPEPPRRCGHRDGCPRDQREGFPHRQAGAVLQDRVQPVGQRGGRQEL